MKTTLFTTVAAFAGLVLANPIAYTGEALRSSIIEERQGDGTQNYGQKVGACQQLKRQFPKLVAYPNAPLYRFEQDQFWSQTCRLEPSCVFQPRSAQHVAEALKIIVATNTQFAVRSGGHMPNPGANNVNNGVLIGMDGLNITKLSTFGGVEVAQVGPGLRWTQVYDWIAPQGKIVNGGRYSPVGVGGLLLGGGLSYFGSENGWASNLVQQYELVTANSSILYVTKESYPDLFWALRGGSTNFGIVTRFDLKTFPLVDVWAGFVNTDAANIPKLLDATAQFVAPKTGGSLDPKAAIDVTVFFNATSRLFSSTTSIFYNASVSTAPPALVNFTKIPTTSLITARKRTYVDFVTETEYSGNRNFRQLFRAASQKSTPAAVKFGYDIFKSKTQTLRPIPGLILSFVYQPLTVDLLRQSRRNGGDAIDLDPADGPILGLIINAAWNNAADDAYVNAWCKDFLDTVDARGRTAGYYYDFIFLNDAANGQKVLSKYGKGASLPRLRRIAQRYDPQTVFQRLDGGSFKVSTQ
ncbi:MAG: hypothetical protein LQ345_002248 [Seirophora villosa]|nr:MAG: hypothetical protein LQ345_002248 [Seirophora villosa]